MCIPVSHRANGRVRASSSLSRAENPKLGTRELPLKPLVAGPRKKPNLRASTRRREGSSSRVLARCFQKRISGMPPLAKVCPGSGSGGWESRPKRSHVGIDGFVMEIGPDEAGPDGDGRFAEDEATAGLQRRRGPAQELQGALQVVDAIEDHEVARFARGQVEIVSVHYTVDPRAALKYVGGDNLGEVLLEISGSGTDFDHRAKRRKGADDFFVAVVVHLAHHGLFLPDGALVQDFLEVVIERRSCHRLLLPYRTGIGLHPVAQCGFQLS